MREALVPILIIGTLLLVPAVISDGSEGADTHTVTFRDYDGSEIATAEVVDGRGVTSSAIHLWNMRPYWYDFNTGYKWTADKPVTRDLYLQASETEPPTEPEGDRVYLVPVLGGGLLAVGVLAVWIVYRRR